MNHCPDCGSDRYTLTFAYEQTVQAPSDELAITVDASGYPAGVIVAADLLGLVTAEVICDECGHSSDDVETQVIG